MFENLQDIFPLEKLGIIGIILSIIVVFALFYIFFKIAMAFRRFILTNFAAEKSELGGHKLATTLKGLNIGMDK